MDKSLFDVIQHPALDLGLAPYSLYMEGYLSYLATNTTCPVLAWMTWAECAARCFYLPFAQ
jgi:hypothetical protein